MNAGILALAQLAKYVAMFQAHMSVGMQPKVFLSTIFTTTRSKVFFHHGLLFCHMSKCLNFFSITVRRCASIFNLYNFYIHFQKKHAMKMLSGMLLMEQPNASANKATTATAKIVQVC